MIISERIFSILTEKGISQKLFSEMTGISQSTISDWKRKKTNPASDKIMVISDALKVSVYDLLNGTESGAKKTVDYMIIDKGSDEYELLETYRNLNQKAKERLRGDMQALTEQNNMMI